MAYDKSLFIFRRDLRLVDNTALIAALKQSSQVIPCFIFDPIQVGNKNSYKSDLCMQFMYESLLDLQNQLADKDAKLFLFYGEIISVVKKIHQDVKFDALFVNRDYTPYSKKRDSLLQKFCQTHNISFCDHDDALLNPPKDILKKDGSPYTVFTAFYKKSSSYSVSKPQRNDHHNYFRKEILDSITLSQANFFPELNNNIASHGGREKCKQRLKTITRLNNYEIYRDYPSKENTTKLSAHLKFTTCSVREIYHYIRNQIKNSEAIIRQLYWRDFFTMIAYHFPYVFSRAFRAKFDSLNWVYNDQLFTKWKNGETGFPIVDAGMRELNQTGYIHNRLRLIVASFLTKDLHMDWRLGEKYFAQKLVDYDPAVNNGNWQWVASTGCDAQPYFRIFNPWLQQKKFDPQCIYIKKWLSELRQVDNKLIHNWYRLHHYIDYDYPEPILNHAIEAEKAKKIYQSVLLNAKVNRTNTSFN